jgi:uncharacterized protein YlxW (UPF0749 family)
MADDLSPPRRRPVKDPPPQAVMGLLNYLTATSLDEDYAHASKRRAATGPSGAPSKGRPGRVALVMLAVFGTLVATAAIQTSRNAAETASSRDSLVQQATDRKEELERLRSLEQSLRSRIATLEASNLEATAQGRAVQDQLSRLGVLTGSAVTRGPGIQVTVDDAPDATSSKQQVQAPDLQKLVNALWLLGAEAISVNGQRLTSLSPIRDAAGAITVNFVSLRRPYVVSAIGNTSEMGAQLLDTAGGQTLLTLQSTFGLQFDVDNKDSMVLPAARRVTLRSAHEPVGRR